MRFPYPLLPAEFEIPDDWWTEAGMTAFTLAEDTYRSSGGAQPIALREIEPPFRSGGCPKDFGGFDRKRLVAVLRGIAGGDEIPPVQLRALKPLNDWHRLPFTYQVDDGFHRFYASVAAGFEFLPASIV